MIPSDSVDDTFKHFSKFDIKTIREEYGQEFEKRETPYDSLLGKYNNQKGIYERVWHYDYSPDRAKRFNIDVYARALSPGDYSLIGEVKNRDSKKFSKEEAVEFERKYNALKEAEHLDRVVGFVFSRTGFTQEAEEYCREKGFACTDDEQWLTG